MYQKSSPKRDKRVFSLRICQIFLSAVGKKFFFRLFWFWAFHEMPDDYMPVNILYEQFSKISRIYH